MVTLIPIKCPHAVFSSPNHEWNPIIRDDFVFAIPDCSVLCCRAFPWGWSYDAACQAEQLAMKLWTLNHYPVVHLAHSLNTPVTQFCMKYWVMGCIVLNLLLWAASQVKMIKMYMKRELAQTKHQNHTLTIYFQINWVCFAVCLLQRTVSCCVETMVSLPPITSIESNAVQHWKTITFKGLISSKHGGESLITLFHIYF